MRLTGSRAVRSGFAAAVAVTILFGGAAAALPHERSEGLLGIASWYGPWHHGRPTASGKPFNMHALTAAHRTLPLGTRVRVTNLLNDRSVVVKITDRGPYVPGRSIDLSHAAAKALGMLKRGLASVRLEVLSAEERRTVAGPRGHVTITGRGGGPDATEGPPTKLAGRPFAKSHGQMTPP